MRIALAEDDEELRTSVARGLREAGYDVDQASTGAQTLALVGSARYDAVVLDVLMPAPDGLAVCRAIREGGSRVPILILTARDAVEHRIEGLDAGADDYLTKPFDFGELLARLRAIARRHDESPARLVVGDLMIDTRRHQVRRGDRDIELTAKEFAFLLHLARHAGRVVSRADLMTHVWDDSRSTYSNIIDVYASRLRRKLDDGESEPLFHTVRGAGFMLDPEPTPGPVDPSRGAVRRVARRRS